MNELVYPTIIAGLPTTKANPEYTKDLFKSFIPKFADYIDREKGQVETIINIATVGTVITDSPTKIEFTNDYIREEGDKLVLNIDDSKDVIIGKRTNICYQSGYNSISEVVLTDTSGLENAITISYLLRDEVIKSIVYNLDPNEVITKELDFDFGNLELNSLLTLEISDENNSAEITEFKETVKSNFEAARGDGAVLYEAFCGIADSKIIKTIWNIDWEYGMSLCIAHYIATVNRESEVSYGLGDIARDSGPRGIETVSKAKGEFQTKYDYKNIMLSHNESKFWQSTEFGRILITLLSTKSVLTMIVVN